MISWQLILIEATQLNFRVIRSRFFFSRVAQEKDILILYSIHIFTYVGHKETCEFLSFWRKRFVDINAWVQHETPCFYICPRSMKFEDIIYRIYTTAALQRMLVLHMPPPPSGFHHPYHYIVNVYFFSYLDSISSN